MIRNFQKILSLILIFLISCTKELDISEFSNDFSNYNPEIRIEALILPSENHAIVRIDRSVLITDTDIYNCRDDDFGEISQDSCSTLGGIWHGLTDDLIADCGDWDVTIHDVGKDGQEGDPNDDDGDCENCSLTNSACQEACREEDSIGENNGIPDCGEPNVDEIDEIIKKIHLNNCIVKMTNDNLECPFEYNERADSLFYNANFSRKEEDFSINNIQTPNYGAYIPSESCSSFNWGDLNGEYEFEADCPDYGVIVSNNPIQLPTPVVFYKESDILQEKLISYCSDNECLKNNSSLWNTENQTYNTLYFARYAFNDYIYYSSINPYFYYQSVQYFYDITNDRYIYFHGHPDGATEAETIIGNTSLMGEAVVTDYLEFENTPAINKYYYEMFTFSEDYKNYYFFDLLDLSDPERTNLRKIDSNGNPTIPIMGAFGAMASEKVYFEIIDCEIYETQESCENSTLTKSVCKWYDSNNNYVDSNNNNQYDIGETIVPDIILPICGPIKAPPLEEIIN